MEYRIIITTEKNGYRYETGDISGYEESKLRLAEVVAKSIVAYVPKAPGYRDHEPIGRGVGREDHDTLRAIQKRLDGVEWNADTMQAIAGILTDSGYKVRDSKQMDTAAALQIVLDLARGNIPDEIEHHELHERYVTACNIVEDLAVNEYGDD